MPGPFVALGAFTAERLRAAVSKLEHAPSHSSSIQAIAPQLAIGWAGPRQRIDHHMSSAEFGNEVHVWLYGHAFTERPQPSRIGAREILRDYLTRGADVCHDYEGSFVIVVADLRWQRVYVVPDRLCTHPLYYTRDGDDIVIAPEVKALSAARGLTPTIATDALAGFLSVGYNIGSQTLFEGVQQLEMGKMLEVGMERPRRLSTRRFWKLEFGGTEKLTRRRDAEDALFQAITDAHRLLLADRPPFQILLSGGADSRGMLGVCKSLGLSPARAVTWGLAKEAPRSDASISKALAERFGIPWDFIAAGTDTFVEQCENWAYVSESANDNFGWYAEGFGTLRYLHDSGHPCSLIGDESWGWHGFAYDELHAYSKVLPPVIPASLLALMPERRREAASSAYVQGIREVMRDCNDADWSDRKDYFYLHSRVARFIFSLGYGRGHVLEQRRPFLTRGVLDVVRRMPPEFRVHKNLYVSMLQRHLPDTLGVPVASVNSLPDWSFDLRSSGRLRDCFLDLLHDPVIGSGPLAEVLEPRRLAELRDTFFAGRPSPVSRRARASKILKEQAKQKLWQLPIYKYVDRWTHSRSRREPGSSGVTIAPIDILRRVAILVMLQRQLPRFQIAGDPNSVANERKAARVNGLEH